MGQGILFCFAYRHPLFQIAFVLLEKISWFHLCGPVFLFCIIHLGLYLCQHWIVLIIIALRWILKSDRIKPPTFFFIFKFCCSLSSFAFPHNFRVNLLIPTKKSYFLLELFWIYRSVWRWCAEVSHLVVSSSLWPHGCSLPGSSVHGDSPGKNTGVGCQALLQGIFPSQILNQCFLHCRQIL